MRRGKERYIPVCRTTQRAVRPLHEVAARSGAVRPACEGVDRCDALGARNREAAAALQRLRATYDDRIDYFSRLMNPTGDNATAAGRRSNRD